MSLEKAEKVLLAGGSLASPARQRTHSSEAGRGMSPILPWVPEEQSLGNMVGRAHGDNGFPSVH